MDLNLVAFNNGSNLKQKQSISILIFVSVTVCLFLPVRFGFFFQYFYCYLLLLRLNRTPRRIIQICTFYNRAFTVPFRIPNGESITLFIPNCERANEMLGDKYVRDNVKTQDI